VTVYLVGAGPGDPGLLTRRGADLLARADVVVYDRLVDRSLLALAPEGAELVDAGKQPAEERARTPVERPGATRQDEINELLVSLGRAGRTVVRLKGGDPFVFGRGGEEAEALGAAGVPYEVVPGVTSAFAAPAYAGIPVTHRGLSTSVTVVTGHVGTPGTGDGVRWEDLARAGGTLVILMGMATRAEIARRLVAGGRSPGTPVAVVEWGTTPAQRSTRTTLEHLGDVNLDSPSVIVVGPVAGLDLSWLAAPPLAGWSVVVTRPRDQSAELTEALGTAGARVLEVPTIAVADPEDGGVALAEAAAGVAAYRWVAFTSANAVHRFMALLRDARDLRTASLAVVGSATAAALADHGLVPDLVPDRATGEGLAAAFPDPAPGARVLFPRADAARESLPSGLRRRGWPVDEVVAYRTVPAPDPPAEVARLVEEADAVTFTSPSTVAGFLAMTGPGGRPLRAPPVVASIGPVTTRAARDAGLAVAVEAGSPSAADLVAALVDHRLGARTPSGSPGAAGRPGP